MSNAKFTCGALFALVPAQLELLQCLLCSENVSLFTGSHRWHVAELYAPRVAIVALGGAGAALWQPVIVPAIAAIPPMDGFVESLQQPWVVSVLILAALSIWVLLPKSKPDVYLMDFAVFEPPAAWRCTHDDLIEICR